MRLPASWAYSLLLCTAGILFAILPSAAQVTIAIPELSPDRYGATSVVDFSLTLQSGLPKTLQTRQIFLTFTRDSTTGHHFIVPDGPILLGSPAISASNSGDLVGSTATAIGDKSTGVVTITLDSNTYTVNNAAQLRFSLIGLKNPGKDAGDLGKGISVTTTVDTSVRTISVTTKPIEFDLKHLDLSERRYGFSTVVSLTFRFRNYDMGIGDVLKLRMKKFSGVPKTVSKCAKSADSTLERQDSHALFVPSIPFSSTDGTDPYTCSGNSPTGCDVYLTVKSNGLPMGSTCIINITGLSTPAVGTTGVCLSGDCNDQYQIGITSKAEPDNSLSLGGIGSAGVIGALITGPGTLIYKTLEFSAYTPFALHVSIKLSFKYDKTINATTDKIKVYFKDGVVTSLPAKNNIPFSGCGSVTSFNSEALSSNSITIVPQGSNYIEPGLFCSLTIPGMTISNGLYGPGSTDGEYGIQIISEDPYHNMTRAPIYPFPPISGGAITSDEVRFTSPLAGQVATVIHYTFQYNQDITTEFKIKLVLSGFSGTATLGGRNGCAGTTFTVTIGNFPNLELVPSSSIPKNTLCTIALNGGITPLSSLPANSEKHTQQIIKTSSGNAVSTPMLAISQSDMIFAESAPIIYTVKKECKFQGSGSDCDHGKIKERNGDLIVGRSLRRNANSDLDGATSNSGLTIDSASITHDSDYGSGAEVILNLVGASTTGFLDASVGKGGSGYASGDKLTITYFYIPGANTGKVDITIAENDIALLANMRSQPLPNELTKSRYTGLTTTSNGRGKGAIISLNTSSIDKTVKTVQLSCGVDCDGYKVGDTLTVSADQLLGSTKDLVFVLSADDIDYATHCQSCNGRYPEGYSVRISHVPHSACNSGSQVSCEPLRVTHASVELFINPSGHVGDIYCGVFSASSLLPTMHIQRTRAGEGKLEASDNGLFPSVIQQTGRIPVTDSAGITVSTTTSGSGSGATLNIVVGGSLVKGRNFRSIANIVNDEVSDGVSGNTNLESQDAASHDMYLSDTSGTGATFKISEDGATDSVSSITAVSFGSGYLSGDVITIKKTNIGSSVIKDVTFRLTAFDILASEVTKITVSNPGNGYKAGDTLTVDRAHLGSDADLIIKLRQDDVKATLVSKNVISVRPSDKETDLVVYIDGLAPETMYDAYCHFANVTSSLSATTRSGITNFWTRPLPAVWGDSLVADNALDKLTLTFTHGQTIPEYGELVLLPYPTSSFFDSSTSCKIRKQDGGNTATIKTTSVATDNKSLKLTFTGAGSTVTTSHGKKLVIECTILGTSVFPSSFTYDLYATGHETLRNRAGDAVS